VASAFSIQFFKPDAFGYNLSTEFNDPEALEAAAGQFDLVLSTVNVKLDCNKYIGTLKTRGRLHVVGATLEALDLQLFPMLMGQRSVSAYPVGSYANIVRMQEFAARHKIKPIIEKFRLDQINEPFERLKSGQATSTILPFPIKACPGL
jgi:uncharacterized zinc-type alcohol dehydrogenase-like protein